MELPNSGNHDKTAVQSGALLKIAVDLHYTH